MVPHQHALSRSRFVGIVMPMLSPSSCPLASSLALLLAFIPPVAQAQDELPSYLVWPPSLKHKNVPAPAVFRGVVGEARFETNRLGIRGPEFSRSPEDEYRILVLGGSAVESFYLDQEEAWPALVGAGLPATADGRKVWVGNLGRSGHNSRDHVMEMRLLVPRLPIDVIVVMMGVNDLGLRLAQDAAYNPAFLESPANVAYQIRHAFAVRPSDPNLPFYRQGWVGRFLGLEPESLRVKPWQVVDNAGWAFQQWRELRWKGPKVTTLPALSSALEEFASNAAEIAWRGREMGARVVFLTQPALWRADLSPAELHTLWMGGIGDYQGGGASYYAAEALARGLAAYNQALLDFCNRTGAECFDLASRVPLDLTIFYDDCHFNENGARVVAESVVGYLAKRAPWR